MAMLAEPRSRQKWSSDPRNIRWASDKSKFGYQMLTKMGWSEGKGLGQNESGQVSHVKVKKRKCNSGIGSKHSHDDDWISHQNDFNDLLSSLNSGCETGRSGNKIKSLEERVKSSKKKILYTKFVKSKDLSNASPQDLACIFGTRSKSAPATPNLSDEDDGNASDCSAASCPAAANHIKEHGFTTVNTGVSVTDYFAKKMASLKATKKEIELTRHYIASDSTETENLESLQSKSVDQAIIIESDLDSDQPTKKKKKKKRKLLEEHIREQSLNCTDEIKDQGLIKQKAKKKKRYIKNEDMFNENYEDNDKPSKDKKKKKKKTRKEEENNL